MCSVHLRDRDQERTMRLLGAPGRVRSLGAGEQEQCLFSMLRRCNPHQRKAVNCPVSWMLQIPAFFHGNAQDLHRRRWLVTHTSRMQTEISLWYRAQLTEAIQCICLEESDSKRNRRTGSKYQSCPQSHNPRYRHWSRTLCPSLPRSVFAEIMN